MKPSNVRSLPFDFIRAFACLSVVLFHAACRIEDFAPDESYPQRIGLLFESFTLFSVPLFLMISGYFLLNREYDVSNVASFYRKRFRKILPPLIFWPCVYALFGLCFHKGSSPLGEQLRSFLTTGYFPFAEHLWYLILALELYLIAPILANGVRKFSPRFLLVVSGILFCARLIDYLIVDSLGADSVNSILFIFLKYVPYFIAGKALGDILVQSARPRLVIWGSIGFAVSSSLTFLLCLLNPDLEFLEYGFLDYCFFGSCIQSVSLYVAALSLGDTFYARFAKPISIAAALSFGVYLVHFFGLDLTTPIGTALVNFPILAIASKTVLALAFSIFVVCVMRKIPFLNRFV